MSILQAFIPAMMTLILLTTFVCVIAAVLPVCTSIPFFAYVFGLYSDAVDWLFSSVASLAWLKYLVDMELVLTLLEIQLYVTGVIYLFKFAMMVMRKINDWKIT